MTRDADAVPKDAVMDATEADGLADEIDAEGEEAPGGDEVLVVQAEAAHAGLRLDAVIAAATVLSRVAASRLIEAGRVSVDGVVVAKQATKAKAGQTLEISVPAAVTTELVAEPLPLTVLFEDEHLIVVDKAAGMVVHPAPGHARGTLVNALLYHCHDLSGIGGELRPGIVHRLDKDTSGVMVASKHDAVHIALSELFAKKALVREYVALCHPGPRLAQGRIATLYGRHPTDRKRFTGKVPTGKPAATNYEVVERFACGAAEVRCRLETGRTHQIRVHLSEAGSPLLGDPIYGRTLPPKLAELRDIAARLARQALHATKLAFVHPITAVPLAFTTAPPADYQAARRALLVAKP